MGEIFISRINNEEGFNMPSNHFHNRYEIYYLLEGDRYYFIKNRTYYVNKGSLVIINKNVIHRTMSASSKGYDRILIEFASNVLKFFDYENDINVLSCFFNNIPIIHLNEQKQKIIQNVLFEILEEYNNVYIGKKTYITMLITELLILIYRFQQQYTPDNNINSLDNKVFEVVNYINKNYIHNITIDKLAKIFYLSPCYLCKCFKKITGFTIIEYVNNVRIKESQQLLSNYNYNITEISEKVGYNSISHFGRIFKQKTGITPMYYKKNNKSYVKHF